MLLMRTNTLQSWQRLKLALGAERSAEAIVRTLLCLSGFGVLSFTLGWIPLEVGLQRLKSFEI